MRKFSALVFAACFAFSCSSNDDSNSNQTVLPTMSATIDGNIYGMAPEIGGNLSDPTGGMYGSDYHLLEGFRVINLIEKPTAKPSVPYNYYVRLAIPKIDVSLGEHTFTNTHLPDGYFADLEINSDTTGEGEDEVTINGKIIVTDWDASTQRIKGIFDFKTNDGVSSTQTHVVTGTFNYILAN